MPTSMASQTNENKTVFLLQDSLILASIKIAILSGINKNKFDG